MSRLFGFGVVAYVLVARPPDFLPAWLTEVGELAGFAMLAVAAFGRLWCLMFIAGQKNGALIAEGPYSVVRNPLYVFSFVGAVGFGLAAENLLLAATIAVFCSVAFSLAVVREERRLGDLFGATYSEYCARTPRWIPAWHLYYEPKALTVRPAKIRRGILDAMWFLWAFLLWEGVEAFRGIGLLKTLI